MAKINDLPLLSNPTEDMYCLVGKDDLKKVPWSAIMGQIGAPYIATTVAGMTDKTRVYVYQGSESGYTSGNWYYWNGSAWTSGGTYNSAAVDTDKTLTQSDKPADSAVVGQQIGSLKESLNDLEKASIDVTEKTSELDQSCVKNEMMTDSVYNGRAGDNPNILNKMCLLESDGWQTFETNYCSVSYSVAEGEQYRITGTNINGSFSLINLFDTMEDATKGILYYPSKDMINADKEHYTGLKIQDYVVKIPSGCVRMVLNSHRSSTIKIEKITGYKDFKSETEKTLTDLNNSDDLKDFQIKNLQQRLFDTGKYNDFAFKEFDKTYFAFVIDDSNKTLYPIYKIFHDKGVKLSSATIPGNLNIAVEGIGTNKDVLDLIVADGGEVLVHYYGNLIDIGEQAPDTDRTYLNTVEDWDSRIVVTKKALEDMGYKIRGVIRADYTSSRTKTGEQYCREYYDYSDGLGTSPQYTLTRMFVHNFSTVEDFKKWIDKCCEKPGFYPICTHGSESVNDNMDEILDYILNKDNCECTTYKDVYDQFRSTVLENRIKALEEKVSG